MAAAAPREQTGTITEEDYQAARNAHDEIFLAESADPKVSQEYESFKTQYSNIPATGIKVVISGLTSWLRIILIRKIMQFIFEQEKQAENRELRETKVFYLYNDQDYDCQHKPVKKNKKTQNYELNKYQPGNVHLNGIGSYFEDSSAIEKKINGIETLYQDIAKKIRESRTTGKPIKPIKPDGLKEKEGTAEIEKEKKEEDAGLMYPDLNLITALGSPYQNKNFDQCHQPWT